MFTEGDSDDEIVTTPPGKGGYTHLDRGQGDYDNDDNEARDRSQSTGSEQIGRFEVSTSVHINRNQQTSLDTHTHTVLHFGVAALYWYSV